MAKHFPNSSGKKITADIVKKIRDNGVRSPLEVNAKLKIEETKEGANETTYKQIIGSLRFLCNSRPDSMFSVSLLSRFMGNPKKSHMMTVKRILRYIKGIANYEILFPYGLREDELKFVCYVDSDYGGDQVERKSTSGNIFFLNKAHISRSSKKQFLIKLQSRVHYRMLCSVKECGYVNC
ncbi:secreted RxLR effector protein 161-like [Vigna angularis]|uniref:secreted RxLR effector protein 161-like n=1 Tax=Phaseolus angularis TaxID=3914 RepID=UPI000809BCA0|nr:secreted RxLR effector protein 161-like [Vigna angularis]